MKIFLPSARHPDVTRVLDLPKHTKVIFTGDEQELSHFPYPYEYIQREGYWSAMNWCLFPLASRERFVWLADDVNPQEGWFQHAIECFELNFPDGLGLVALNDGHLKWGGCAFGVTTPIWLWVLFGHRYFPSEFGHKFVDTICADFSKDLDRYYFCEEAGMEHMHHQFGKSENDDVYDANQARARKHQDKKLKDKYDKNWARGGKKKAKERMKDVS